MSIQSERTKAQLELVGDIMRTDDQQKLYNVVQAVMKLASMAKAVHKRYENACNYAWACEEKYERRTDKMETQAVELAASIGLTLGLQSDPRGWPFIIRVGMCEHRLG